MVEWRSIAFDTREERARWRQGPRCLSCLKLRMVGGLGGLMMTPRRSSRCGACIPELTARRPAPWTVAGTVDRCYAWAAELKNPHLKGGIDVSPAVPLSICLFVGFSPCWRHRRSGISSATSRTELIPHNYRQYWCTQQTTCSTHTHPCCN